MSTAEIRSANAFLKHFANCQNKNIQINKCSDDFHSLTDQVKQNNQDSSGNSGNASTS